VIEPEWHALPAQPESPPPTREQLARGIGALLAAAVGNARSMGELPACERRPWPGDEVCGAVLVADVDTAGKHVHYCGADLSAHDVATEHVCVCGRGWAERVDGVATPVGPNETIVRPRQEQP